MPEYAAMVYVVDDDPAIRTSLDSLLRAAGFRVRTFASAQDFRAVQIPDAPACLLLDVRMPGTSGLDLQDELARAGINVPIVFMTVHGQVPESVRALKAGATHFLTKPFRPQHLLEAISKALEGDCVAREERIYKRELHERYTTLTPRERDVLRLVVAGLLNKEVASELRISEVTVKLHRGRVMHKMHAASLAELVRMVENLDRQATGAAGCLGRRPR
jgi:FixJ family two-component response regulator